MPYPTTAVLTSECHAPYMTHILWFSSNLLEISCHSSGHTKAGHRPDIASGVMVR